MVVPALTLAGTLTTVDSPAAVLRDARAWLARADDALARLSYRGVFVHEYGGETETLRVIHRVAGDGVSERLVSMDGSGREFIRRNGELSCYLPDRRTVLVVRSAQPSLPLNVPQIDEQWAGQYEVRQVAITRVSGHRTRVVAVRPLDALRYGYQVWIDDATGMPLKTQLRDSRGSVLEQILFTQLALPAHILDGELRPGVDARGYRWIRRPDSLTPMSQGAVALPVVWRAGALPAGFRMTANSPQLLASGPAEHLVFSDGLASVSVFIQPARTGRDVHVSDAATLGTSSAYSVVASGYRITAVGEVPPETARAIAQSIQGNEAMPEPMGGVAVNALGGAMPPALDVNGTGALLIMGNIGNGNFAAEGDASGNGNGFGASPPVGPYRVGPPDRLRAASAAAASH